MSLTKSEKENNKNLINLTNSSTTLSKSFKFSLNKKIIITSFNKPLQSILDQNKLKNNLFPKVTSLIYKYKSELCKNYEILGYCPYGDKCDYAHGIKELRGINNNNQNFRIKKCKSFFLNGFCPYGNRCQFSHKIFNNKMNEKIFLIFLYLLGNEIGFYNKKRLKIFYTISSDSKDFGRNL
jgi:hypothetical protein